MSVMAAVKQMCFCTRRGWNGRVGVGVNITAFDSLVPSPHSIVSKMHDRESVALPKDERQTTFRGEGEKRAGK